MARRSRTSLTAGLLGRDYTPGQMTYDLRRLRLNGLICRLPRTNRYVLTGDGIRISVFYTKIYNRLLVPLTAANQPQAPGKRRPSHHVLGDDGSGRCLSTAKARAVLGWQPRRH